MLPTLTLVLEMLYNKANQGKVGYTTLNSVHIGFYSEAHHVIYGVIHIKI